MAKKHEAWKGFASYRCQAVLHILRRCRKMLHTAKPCFIKRLFRWSIVPLSFHNMKHLLSQIWSTSVLSRLYNIELILYLRQSNRLAFLFSPPRITLKNRPAECPESYRPHPKQYKGAHLLRFFGNPLCHPRNLTQCVTYYKSTLVYYNIPGSFSQAAIHTRRDSNRSLFILEFLLHLNFSLNKNAWQHIQVNNNCYALIYLHLKQFPLLVPVFGEAFAEFG